MHPQPSPAHSARRRPGRLDATKTVTPRLVSLAWLRYRSNIRKHGIMPDTAMAKGSRRDFPPNCVGRFSDSLFAHTIRRSEWVAETARTLLAAVVCETSPQRLRCGADFSLPEVRREFLLPGLPLRRPRRPLAGNCRSKILAGEACIRCRRIANAAISRAVDGDARKTLHRKRLCPTAAFELG